MKISTCIAAALLVTSTTAGCGSCAKDDSPAPVPSDTPPTALTDRKAAPMPRFFERKPPPKIEGLIPAPAGSGAPVVEDAGPGGATADGATAPR